jgi:hypothetical protein
MENLQKKVPFEELFSHDYFSSDSFSVSPVKGWKFSMQKNEETFSPPKEKLITGNGEIFFET